MLVGVLQCDNTVVLLNFLVLKWIRNILFYKNIRSTTINLSLFVQQAVFMINAWVDPGGKGAGTLHQPLASLEWSQQQHPLKWSQLPLKS